MLACSLLRAVLVDHPARTPAASTLQQAEDLRELVLRELVLRYLAEHPGAMDTLDGIAEWWVMREQLRVDLQRLSRVLDDLTRQGILEETSLGAERAYRLAPQVGAAAARGGQS